MTSEAKAIGGDAASGVRTDLRTPVFPPASLLTAKRWEQPTCPSASE